MEAKICVFFVVVLLGRKRAFSDLLLNKQPYATEIKSCSQLVGLRSYENYHFAIKSSHYYHVPRYVKARVFSNTAGVFRTNLYDCQLQG